MFCYKCGTELPNGVKFCHKCGADMTRSGFSGGNPNAGLPQNPNPGLGGPNPGYGGPNPGHGGPNPGYGGPNPGHGGSNSGRKSKPENNFNQGGSNAEKLEKLIPTILLGPVVIFAVIIIINILFFGLLGFAFSPYYGIGSLLISLMSLIRILVLLVTIAALGYTVYLAIMKKNISQIWTWILPIALLMSLISCIGAVFRSGAIHFLFGAIALVFAFELIARITIGQNSMDTPVNYQAAFEYYKTLLQSTRKNSPAGGVTLTPSHSSTDSYFDGSGLELLGWILLAALVTPITCGIAFPWIYCKIVGWRLSHTVIKGKRLTFTGSGAELLGKWILWSILTTITCGIYSLFTYVALTRWEVEHTFFENEIVPNTSSYDGSTAEVIGYNILYSIVCILTCGLAAPWVVNSFQRWDTSHQVINGHRLKYTGSAVAIIGECIIIALLTLVTCGLFIPWGIIRMNRYIISHTEFETPINNNQGFGNQNQVNQNNFYIQNNYY